MIINTIPPIDLGSPDLVIIRCDCGWLGFTQVHNLGARVECHTCRKHSMIVRDAGPAGPVLAFIEAYAYHTRDMLASAGICFEKRSWRAGLIIVYSTIDSLAWLDRRDGQPDVSRIDFVRWCDDFLLPGSGLPCTSMDLYSARCAVLHTPGMRSRLIREGSASPIYYSGTHEHATKVAEQCRAAAVTAHVLVIADLVRAVVKACDRFGQHLRDSSDRHNTYRDRLLHEAAGRDALIFPLSQLRFVRRETTITIDRPGGTPKIQEVVESVPFDALDLF